MTVEKEEGQRELLVLCERGIYFVVPAHYGNYQEFDTLHQAISNARALLRAGHARAFVAIRIEADVINGIGDGTDRELSRFEVYLDRVVLVPPQQGGLSDEQKSMVLALPTRSRKRFV